MKMLNRLWRNKGKIKLIFILLLGVSILFIAYQFVYYNTLNDYQSEEFKSQIITNSKREGPTHNKEGETPKGIPEIPKVGKLIASGKVLGVSPEYWRFYDRSSRRLFTCMRSNRKITWDKVNDDFCDCPLDGSDEPSTAACMNGRFFCAKHTKGYPEYIPSSRVNDDICDCCDGSDEYEHFLDSKCKNHCL